MERRHTDTHEREFLHIHFRLSMTKMEQKLNESTNRIAVMEKQISDKDSQIASLRSVHVGVFINIMRGDLDAKLHWPIRYRRNFILTNQLTSNDNLIRSCETTKQDLEEYPECYRRPTEYRNEGFGHASFISNTDILGE